MDLGVFLAKQFDSAVHQQRPEDVDDPVELSNQSDSRQDENSAHDQRSQNSPEQNFVLVDRGYLEIPEDEKKDEKIIDTEGKFNHVSGDELQRGGTPVPKVNNYREDGRQCDPHGARKQRLTKFHNMSATVEDSQVEDQHHQDEKIKQDPEKELTQGSPKGGLEIKIRKSAKRSEQTLTPLLKSKIGNRKSDYILSSKRTVSSTTLPTISRLLGLSLSSVSCGVWWKTSL